MIGPTTLALRKVRHPQFQTVIYDREGIYYSTLTPIELLNEACIRLGGSDYEGRIRAIRQLFDYNKKTPLIISHENALYAIPTLSPENDDCLWIFPYLLKNHAVENKKLFVTFKNNFKCELNCSLYVFNRQLEKAARAYVYFLQTNYTPTHMNANYISEPRHCPYK